MTTVLYVGMRHDYGDPSRGDCYEYANLVDSFRHMPEVHLAEFYFDLRLRELGRKGMNKALLRTVNDIKPDVCFFFLFTDEIASETIALIRKKGYGVTVNWFGDDHWRFLPFSRRWAPLFDWVVTTDSAAFRKYGEIGCRQVIKSQWGFNHYRVRRQNLSEEYDVTFVGQAYARRKHLLAELATRGIAVNCWGYGWEKGRLAFDDMVAMCARSRISLNFTDSSIVAGWKRLAKIALNRRADDRVRVNSPAVMTDFVRTLLAGRAPQIKGRNFEVPGAGGFLLTSAADNLDEYFVPGEEIVVFESLADLAEKVRYYLGRPEERQRIRHAGYRRAQRDHTYERRLHDILVTIGAVARN